MASAANDFNRIKAAWLIENANPEAVKSFKTTGYRLVCMSTSGVGSLIQAAVGSVGGVGGLVNRSG